VVASQLHRDLRGLALIGVDCTIAWLLARVAAAGWHTRATAEAKQMARMPPERRADVSAAPLLSTGHYTASSAARSAALFWLLNPMAIVACGLGSTTVHHAAAATAVLALVAEGRVVPAAAAVALGGSLAVHLWVLLAPVLCMLATATRGVTLRAVGALGFAAAVITIVSYLWAGRWRWVDAVYGASLRVDDHSPNTGLCWYLFTVTFPQFREYFLSVVHLNAAVAAVLMAYRLRADPAFVGTLMLGVYGILRPYPAAPDFALVLGLLATRPELGPFCEHRFVAGGALLALAILAGVFWRTWMHDAGGNANFFYALTLAYAVTQCIVINDHLRAHLTIEWMQRHGLPRSKLKLA